MEVRHFRYFVQIVDSRSLSGAADVLHVAQPALSQQLAQLESELGISLLKRSIRGVQPTPAGDAFYRQAKSILRQLADIPAIINTFDQDAVGRVALGLPASTASVIGLDLLARMSKRLPGVTVEINEFPGAYLAELLAIGRLEIAVLVATPLPRGVTGERLLVEEIPLISPRGLLPDVGPISLQKISSLPLIVPAHPNDLRRQVDEAFRAADPPANYAHQITGTALISRAVRHGVGCALLPWSAVHDDLRFGLVDMHDIEGSPFQRVAWLCQSNNIPLSGLAELVRAEVLALVHEKVQSGGWMKASVSA